MPEQSIRFAAEGPVIVAACEHARSAGNRASLLCRTAKALVYSRVQEPRRGARVPILTRGFAFGKRALRVRAGRDPVSAFD